MTGDNQVMLSQHDILDEKACLQIRERVFSLNANWTRRSDSGFFTLGTASYLDAPQRHAEYLKAASATNPILEAHFEDLYRLVQQFLQQVLGEAVFYDQTYALPGFHVFSYDGRNVGEDNVAVRAHYDLQWMQAIPGLVPSGTLSFTLPIDEPSGGASLEIWHVRYQEAVKLGFSAVEYASTHTSQVIKYQRGRMVVNDGMVLHAIGRASTHAPKGYRITLQGHGVRTPDGWLLYW
ncbi:MAG: hypothetical protein WCC64_14905 [Aliidongia sp.]